MSHQVAILGGGPAGLSAAQRLAELGIKEILLIEREEALGGVPRHCGHPAFGLREFHRLLGGPAYARRLAAAASGIEIRSRTTVTAIDPGGRIRCLDPDHGESALEARAILLAFGVRETPRSARLIGGDRPWGVITTGALQQFVYLQKIRPFRRAVIVGSELVAFSALLTLRHGGIATAAMIEEGPRITARRPADILARLALGVPVLTSTRLLTIHGIGKVESVEVERAGRREHIACDGVVFTGRFRPETGILATSHIALDRRHRRARHRSILAQQRCASLRRRQSPASRGDCRRGLGRGSRRRRGHRRASGGSPARTRYRPLPSRRKRRCAMSIRSAW